MGKARISLIDVNSGQAEIERVRAEKMYVKYLTTPSRTHTHPRAHAHTRTHAHTHTRTHAHTHTRTHTHTHARITRARTLTRTQPRTRHRYGMDRGPMLDKFHRKQHRARYTFTATYCTSICRAKASPHRHRLTTTLHTDAPPHRPTAQGYARCENWCTRRARRTWRRVRSTSSGRRRRRS